MTVQYDLYQPGSSWLHKLDPRVKLLGALCGCLLLLTMRNVWVMLAALIGAQAILLSTRIRANRLGWVWHLTLPTMVLIAVLWVAFYPDRDVTWIHWWLFWIGPRNVAEGAAIALRIGALALIIFGWLFTTDQADLVLSFIALGLPYPWGLALSMALRYLPTMANTFRMISEAQQARALDLTKGGPLRRARAYVPITIAMLITSLRMAQSLAWALESRAFGALPRRTFLRQLRFSRRDAVLTLVILLFTAIGFWARIALGFGADALHLING